jgi:hypothetical protein
MSAPDLLLAMRDAGLIATVADGRLHVAGPADALDRFRPTIRDQRNGLLLAIKTGANDVQNAYRWWLLHYLDRDPVEVSCTPPASHTEILDRHPDAVAAEPFTPTIRQPSAPLTASEETAIRAWLALIEETDAAMIAEVIEQCQRDTDARDYFIQRAQAEVPKPEPFSDDRRTCNECANLRGRVCTIASPGGLASARKGYEPNRNLLRRCEGYSSQMNYSSQ